LAVLLIVAVAVLPGCNGVMLNAEFDRLLDQTADLSAETANRAHAGLLTGGDMRDALVYQAYVWAQFRNARDGIKADPQPTTQPTTQPVSLMDLVHGPQAAVACKTIR